jgi:hypothetical protein
MQIVDKDSGIPLSKELQKRSIRSGDAMEGVMVHFHRDRRTPMSSPLAHAQQPSFSGSVEIHNVMGSYGQLNQ